jgi:hypothetical protein
LTADTINPGFEKLCKAYSFIYYGIIENKVFIIEIWDLYNDRDDIDIDTATKELLAHCLARLGRV